MTTLTEPPTVETVVKASNSLCAFRAGFAEALALTAERAVVSMPDVGTRQLEPLLRILGEEKADDYARRLYVAACQVIGNWDPDADVDAAAHALERLTHEAAHAVADELYRDTRICCAAHIDPAGGIQL